MDQLQTFVPAVNSTKQLSLLEDGVAELEDEDFHRILIGGDQLTVARCCGSAAVRSDHSTSRERLCGLTPVSEDWYAKRSYLLVCLICDLSYVVYLYTYYRVYTKYFSVKLLNLKRVLLAS